MVFLKTLMAVVVFGVVAQQAEPGHLDITRDRGQTWTRQFTSAPNARSMVLVMNDSTALRVPFPTAGSCAPDILRRAE